MLLWAVRISVDPSRSVLHAPWLEKQAWSFQAIQRLWVVVVIVVPSADKCRLAGPAESHPGMGAGIMEIHARTSSNSMVFRTENFGSSETRNKVNTCR